MTVKELKELLAGLKDDKEIICKLDNRYFTIEDAMNSNSTNEIILNITKED